MLAALNSLLKTYTPKLHNVLKEYFRQTNLPAPKRLLGRLVWTHPRLLNHQITERHVLQWIAKGLRPGDVFFDVGAHLGWMSLVAARQTGFKGKVVAFEPSPPLVDYLSYHKQVNRLSQMDIVPKAVTNRDKLEVPFFLVGDGDAFMNSLLSPDTPDISRRGKSVIQVETTTLDSFSHESELVPTMIKIDVEGAEIWVCEGARHILSQYHPALIIAIHPPWLPHGQRIEDLHELLSSYGYQVKDSQINNDGGFGDYLYTAKPIKIVPASIR